LPLTKAILDSLEYLGKTVEELQERTVPDRRNKTRCCAARTPGKQGGLPGRYGHASLQKCRKNAAFEWRSHDKP
jgi:hypothetical protein